MARENIIQFPLCISQEMEGAKNSSLLDNVVTNFAICDGTPK